MLYHIVFSTKGRRPDISPEIQAELYPYMASIVKAEKCKALIINGTRDHVHMLVSIIPSLSVANFIRSVKANSSRWICRRFENNSDFEWQVGYGAFTVSPSRKNATIVYIQEQEAHHKKKDYKTEFLQLLKVHGIAHDERFVFD